MELLIPKVLKSPKKRIKILKFKSEKKKLKENCTPEMHMYHYGCAIIVNSSLTRLSMRIKSLKCYVMCITDDDLR